MAVELLAAWATMSGVKDNNSSGGCAMGRISAGFISMVLGLGVWVATASAAVTPGWECIPITAGQPVVSGGAGNVPSCSGSTTPVLAPTYVASGVGGKPTVEFSTVNVQVTSGSGSTNGAVNGKGNLIIGYDEKAGAQTGSNNLVLGYGQSYTSYGSLVAGSYDTDSGAFGAVLGESNRATGYGATATGGEKNAAEGHTASVSGGTVNKAKGTDASITGGFSNLASGSAAAVLAGEGNVASGAQAAVSGGCGNAAGSVDGYYDCAGQDESVTGGEFNSATDAFSTVVGGCVNGAGALGIGPQTCSTVSPQGETILGGIYNRTGSSNGEEFVAYPYSTILGGYANNVTARCEAVPATPNNNC